ncbi:hypothetical protein BJ912DRAFT_957370 [Pholiota molesta]|nr:hypothetical protein BJ912DRAFT_957370 [Pholiota molesta]
MVEVFSLGMFACILPSSSLSFSRFISSLCLLSLFVSALLCACTYSYCITYTPFFLLLRL